MVTRKVLIVGGGCAGLSAAHEVVKLNRSAARTGVRFEVDVLERADFLGGKCASQYDPAGGEGRYPGEHGFRFFPQFYSHLTETLREIPYPDPDSHGTVFQNLRSPGYGAVAYGGELTVIPRHLATASIDDILRVLLGDLVERLSAGDLALYSFHLLRFLSACRERRLAWDRISWEEFLGFDRPGYTEEGKQLLRMVPSVLSAMRARDSSARTIGNTSLQVAFGFHPWDPDPKDGILCGPTTEVWLDPWVRHLTAQGVRFHLNRPAVDFVVTDGRLTGVVVDAGTTRETHTADGIILAVPIEVTIRFLRTGRLPTCSLTNLLTVPIPPRWRKERQGDWDSQLRRTWTADMIGVQYFLKEDVHVVDGHLALPGSDWCLTAVAQHQYWTHGLARYGVPDLRGVLSVIVSDWDAPSARTGKTARQHLSEGEEAAIVREAWEQMRDAIGPSVPLEWSGVLHARIDRNVTRGANPLDDTFNPTPLLIHPIASYTLRPDGRTGLPGLYVASDYNRTHVDLASMEGANEGARQAVGALAEDAGIPDELHPKLYPMDEGPAFALVQAVDAALFKAGLPHVLEARTESISARLKHLASLRPFRVLGAAAEDVLDKVAHGVGWRDTLTVHVDRDGDGDLDVDDLRLLARGLLLGREVGGLRQSLTRDAVRALDQRLRR